jgi:hypothetical protein
MLESTRSPLSWRPLENNLISCTDLSASSSGSAVYRYDDANSCARLAREAQECFMRIRREEPAPSKKLDFWSTCIAIDVVILFGVAGFHKRMPAYHRFSSCMLIGVLFFLVVCLPMLVSAGKELDKVRQIANPIYERARILIDSIKERLDALVTIFPENIVQGGAVRDMEITEKLKDNLDQWIDTLRMVHGWDDLAQHWNPPERAFVANHANSCRYFVNETFNRYRSTRHLVEVISKIEEFRASIIRTLYPQTEQERDTPAMTRVANGLLRQLLGLIYRNMGQEREEILRDLKSLNRAYRERQKSR